MRVAPGVEGEGGLLKEGRRHLTTGYREVEGVERLLRFQLVGLLHPHPAQMPVGDGGGGDLIDVVEATEQDLLSGGQVGQLQRAGGGTPQMPDAQPLDRPTKLGKGAGAVGVHDGTDHQQIGVGVLHQPHDEVEGGGGGFFRRLAALEHPITTAAVPELGVAAAHSSGEVNGEGVGRLQMRSSPTNTTPHASVRVSRRSLLSAKPARLRR